jgi:preprotein translocase subunit SecG
VKIALLTLLVLAIAAVALTLVVVVLVDRSTGNMRAANWRDGRGGEERESE